MALALEAHPHDWAPLRDTEQRSSISLAKDTAGLIRLWRHPERHVPLGKGERVLTLPGCWEPGPATHLIDRYLRRFGYNARGLGTLLPNSPFVSEQFLGLASRMVNNCVEKTGERVTVIGHSMGGPLAMELAAMNPDAIEGVITLGGPDGDDPIESLNPWARAIVHTARFVYPSIEEAFTARGEIEDGIPVTHLVAGDDNVVHDMHRRDRPNAQVFEVGGVSHLGWLTQPKGFVAIGKALGSHRAYRDQRANM